MPRDDPSDNISLFSAGPRTKPSRTAGYEIEEQLRVAGFSRIAGVDEVGRGAWAGPVVVCAAVTDLSPPPVLAGKGGRQIKLTDSKLLTGEHRREFAKILPEWLSAYAIGAAGADEIDELGMTKALRAATLRALEALPERPDMVLLDGAHDFLKTSWPARCEIKADQRSASVAAASVLAKVHRDALMAALDAEYPAYGFGVSAGYPSPAHQQALAKSGPTAHHRMSWSYLDDLPQWRHLKKQRAPSAGQLTLGI